MPWLELRPSCRDRGLPCMPPYVAKVDTIVAAEFDAEDLAGIAWLLGREARTFGITEPPGASNPNGPFPRQEPAPVTDGTRPSAAGLFLLPQALPEVHFGVF